MVFVGRQIVPNGNLLEDAFLAPLLASDVLRDNNVQVFPLIVPRPQLNRRARSCGGPNCVERGATGGLTMENYPRAKPRWVSLFGDEEVAKIGSADDQTVKVQQDDKGLILNVDIRDYRPEEVKVTVENSKRMIRIEGDHEEKSEDGNTYIKRQFVRQFPLPEGCRPDKVVSNLSKEGILMVTAPKEEENKEEVEERNVPIQMET